MKIWNLLIIKGAKVILFNFLRKISLKRKPNPRWSIVIDPGHGGKHSGAVNKTYGYMEKNINLHVTEFMEKYINDQVPQIVTAMTRRTDRTVSLSDRCKLANTGNTDAFISIHTNARVLKGRYGLEIETFHFRGSGEGVDLAECIQDELMDCRYRIPVIDRGVKIGQRRGKDGELKDFYVLRKTNMIAVLVELGFLSDDEEAQLLIKPENQEIMAKAIVDGVVAYLKNRDTVKYPI